MKIIDLHCDVLYKLEKGNGLLDFCSSKELDTNLARLQKANVFVQCFAIFVDPEVPFEKRFEVAKKQVDYFETEILVAHPSIKQITNFTEINALEENELGVILTLEGVDMIGDDLTRLDYFYKKGVRSVGLTWNHANLAADGIEEKRGAGLTELGFEIVRVNNENGVLTDVSHLSERGFWDVIDTANYPVASHSNAKTICPHIRNLTDDQIKALIEKNAMIHVVFYPEFLTTHTEATITDIIKHIDHIVDLGGINHIGFGSDFDGITKHVKNLEHAGKYGNLINELLKTYTKDQVEGFMYRNFVRRYGDV